MFSVSSVLPNRNVWTEDPFEDPVAGTLIVSKLGNSASGAAGEIECRRVSLDCVKSLGSIRRDCCFSLGVGGLPDMHPLNMSSCCSRRLMLRPKRLVISGVYLEWIAYDSYAAQFGFVLFVAR